MATDKPFCSAKRKDGGECQAWPDKSGFCPAHRPDAAQVRVHAGQCRAKHYLLGKRLNPKFRAVIDLLATSITEIHQGKLQPAQGQAMAALATSLIKLTEFAELEARLKALEERAKKG